MAMPDDARETDSLASSLPPKRAKTLRGVYPWPCAGAALSTVRPPPSDDQIPALPVPVDLSARAIMVPSVTATIAGAPATLPPPEPLPALRPHRGVLANVPTRQGWQPDPVLVPSPTLGLEAPADDGFGERVAPGEEHLGTETAQLQRASAVLPRSAPPPRPTPLPLASDGPAPERYEAMRRLGAGSFGTVDLVRDNDIARIVARKRLKPEWQQGDALARFVDEIKVVGQLEHPSIVPIHDVGLDEQGYFFVMKYVEGDTLEQIIDKLIARDPEATARYSYEARAAIFLQVLEAVGFAHERGILHRDLKPENIMVGRHGEVMIMDWGLAKRTGAPSTPPPPPDPSAVPAAGAGTAPAERLTATQAGLIIGTPAYMSPEQARGDSERIDVRSDLYSLAAILYELLTLHHYLTPKATQEQMLAGVQHEEPLSAIAIHHRFAVPPEYTFFLRRGLAKDPAARFQNAAEMAQTLRQIRDGHIAVQCPCTGLKAVGNEWFDFIDAHPIGAVTTAVLTSACTLYGAYGLLHHFVHLVTT